MANFPELNRQVAEQNAFRRAQKAQEVTEEAKRQAEEDKRHREAEFLPNSHAGQMLKEAGRTLLKAFPDVALTIPDLSDEWVKKSNTPIDLKLTWDMSENGHEWGVGSDPGYFTIYSWNEINCSVVWNGETVAGFKFNSGKDRWGRDHEQRTTLDPEEIRKAVDTHPLRKTLSSMGYGPLGTRKRIPFQAERKPKPRRS